MKLAFALITLVLAPFPALAQQPEPAEAAPAPRPATVRVSLQTAEGAIVLELEKERAPVTTANFLRYVDSKKLDGAVFYRTMKLSADGTYGLIQGGPQGDPRKLFPAIAHEPTTKTGLSHADATISMARGDPGTAVADFFITIGELKSLDANPAATGDNQGFAAFGRVVEGMDVVRKILDAPTSLTKGEGVMKGQMIEAPIKIVAARRAN